jgi:UDP-2-acetamido-3-amino-2,3-dideoxy-glucuronate N-acetyltransferase
VTGIALFGCGNWGANHLRVWRELGVLRVVVDADEQRLAAIDDIDTTTSVDEALARDDVDAVVIATPAVTHADLAVRALDAGKHVFVEKPMAVSASEAEKIVAAADASGRVLMVDHVLEFHPAILKLRQLIAAGDLGKVLYLYSNRLNLGRVRTEENALWSFAPHDAALMLRLVGSAPTSVSCTGEAFLSRGVADVTLMSLAFDDGVRAHVFVSWLHPFKEHRFVVVGDRQMAVFDDTSPWDEKLTLYPHRVDWVEGRVPVAHRAEGVAVPLEQGEPLRAACEHFLSCVASGERPLTDGASGMAVLSILEAADASLSEGGVPVRLAHSNGAVVHPTAIVEDGAELGEGTRVWHFTHVMDGARIGAGCSLGQNVFVGRGVRIGDGVKIQNNVSVYEGVTLEDDVFCGPSVVFTNVINPRSEIERKSEYRPTVVRQGASLGANATIVCGVTIGRYAFVGAGAVVTSDVPDHALVVGVPARVVGQVCQCGEKLADGTCPACGRSYP